MRLFSFSTVGGFQTALAGNIKGLHSAASSGCERWSEVSTSDNCADTELTDSRKSICCVFTTDNQLYIQAVKRILYEVIVDLDIRRQWCDVPLV